MEVQYFDDMDIACINGYSFRKDKKTGYYLSSKQINGKRKRLHIYIWELHNGVIEKGYHIHHLDGDKSNNNICNLAKLLKAEHLQYHARTLTEERKQQMREQLEKKARPKAMEWHKSEKGREWHIQHGKNVFQNLSYIKYNCTYCDKEFESIRRYKIEDNKFCCNNCKSAHRRKSGVDNITKKCNICGGDYIANKYSNTGKCKKCRNQIY